MKKYLNAIVIIGLVLFMTAGMVTAAEAEANDTMEEVVVTATRTEQKVEKIPAQVTVITAKEIQKSGANSVPDVLKSVTGVVVTDLYGNGNNQTVDIGGFGETADRHVAIVIDGRRVNSMDLSGTRWATIPVDNIERIEILHGSGAVLYGDNALGGVINIITKRPEEGLSGKGEYGFGNLGTNKLNGYVNAGSESFGAYLGFDLFKTNGYRDRSAANRNSVRGMFSYDTDDLLSLSLELSATDAEYQLPGHLTAVEVAEDRTQSVFPNDEGKDEDSAYTLGLEKDWGANGIFSVNLSYRDQDRESDIASWSSYMTFDIDTVGLTPKYVLEQDLGGRYNRLTVGVDYYDTDYEAYRGAFKGDRTNLYRHSKSTLSGYVQDEYNLTDPLLLNLGVRYEQPEIELKADVPPNPATKETFDDPEWAWNLGLAYAFSPGSKLYGRVYRSFRYPVVDEFTSYFTGITNTNLTQETSLGYEAGLRYSATNKLILDVRGFLINLEDEIAYNGATFQNENLDETRHAGVEGNVRVMPVQYLALYGGAGYMDATFTDGPNNGKNIPLVPEWKANVGLELTLGVLFRIQYNYVGERFLGGDFDNDQKPLDSFETVDVYTSYQYQIAEFFISAKNIFNEKYNDYGFDGSPWVPNGYYPMPEMTYIAGVNLTF